MALSAKDIETLRKLASRYMEYALSDQNNENRELWRKLNALSMQKPMVTIEQICWGEFSSEEFLTCTIEDPYWRSVEWDLRCAIYKWEHLRADMVLNPYISLARPIDDPGFGIETRALDHDKSGGFQSHLFEDQLAEMEDVEKIKTPILTLDRRKEEKLLEEAQTLFAGIAPVKPQGMMLHSGLWDQITFWKGVENCYIDFMLRPELIHAIMERYTNAFLSKIDQINALGVYDITSNMCHCSYTFSDSLPDEKCDPEHPTTFDGWTFTMAQLFTSVSPEINKEFEVPYMSKILSKFGSVYYGCCERLDDRLDIITQMPNIRKISCSPWNDREHFAAILPKQYIMSAKPNPNVLADAVFDEDAVRKDLRRTIAAAKEHGLVLEFLLKDISTVRNDPIRLFRWSEIAREETINSVL